MYADYDFYQNQFFGRKIPEADFSYYASQSSDYIDSLTMGKSKTYVDENSLIQKACCAAAEAMQLNDQGGGVTSESNDGISVTYANHSVTKTNERRIYDAVKFYLINTGLLYRGFNLC